MSADVKITFINNDPEGKDTQRKLNDEWVKIENKGDTSISLEGWKLTDWRPNQQHIHIFNFPKYIDNSTWQLSPGELIFVMTGSGNNQFIPDTNEYKPQYHLYWNKNWFVWNNTGDTACIYDANNNLINTFSVP